VLFGGRAPPNAAAAAMSVPPPCLLADAKEGINAVQTIRNQVLAVSILAATTAPMLATLINVRLPTPRCCPLSLAVCLLACCPLCMRALACTAYHRRSTVSVSRQRLASMLQSCCGGRALPPA
jgi:hypothetical protein